jgi:hypothetical protein
MEFLKKGLSTIENAIEINALKDNRADLMDKRSALEDKIKKYDCQIELKKVIEMNIQSNAITMTSIKQQFFVDNVEFSDSCTVEEFSNKYKNPFFINLFQLYNNLLVSQRVLQTSLDEVSSFINIDKAVYQTKKEELDAQIEKVNAKLKKVRTKQFKN